MGNGLPGSRLGGVVAAVALGLRLRSRDQAIAFTPFLAAGVVASLLWFETYLLT